MKPIQTIIQEQRIMTAEHDENCGIGFLPSPFDHKAILSIIFSNIGGWDHVSVSTEHRCPLWNEMAYIKDIFFYEEECVIQYHPPKSRYVNVHPYCLHMWKRQDSEFELPDNGMI